REWAEVPLSGRHVGQRRHEFRNAGHGIPRLQCHNPDQRRRRRQYAQLENSRRNSGGLPGRSDILLLAGAGRKKRRQWLVRNRTLPRHRVRPFNLFTRNKSVLDRALLSSSKNGETLISLGLSAHRSHERRIFGTRMPSADPPMSIPAGGLAPPSAEEAHGRGRNPCCLTSLKPLAISRP